MTATPPDPPVALPIVARITPPIARPITTRPGFGLRWRTLARVALRMMFHDKLKMIGTLAGVIFAVLLSNQQAGTFLGLIYKNTMFVANSDADIWIAPPGTEAFQPGSRSPSPTSCRPASSRASNGPNPCSTAPPPSPSPPAAPRPSPSSAPAPPRSTAAPGTSSSAIPRASAPPT